MTSLGLGLEKNAHWARAVASALAVCLAGIRPAGKVSS